MENGARKLSLCLNHLVRMNYASGRDGLGVETFVGTSGRVFPKEMKSSPLLRAWLKRLDEAGVNFHLRHKWLGFINSAQGGVSAAEDGDGSNSWNVEKSLIFETPEGEKTVHADAVMLALGGGSWAKLGSDGAWVKWLSSGWG